MAELDLSYLLFYLLFRYFRSSLQSSPADGPVGTQALRLQSIVIFKGEKIASD